MKGLFCVILLFLHTAYAMAAECIDSCPEYTGLAAGFRNPPASARPHTWWHWMNGNITKEGISADLEAMARAGIGGAQIFNVREWGPPPGPVRFNSPEWLDMVKYAAQEASRLGLKLGIHNCAGWSSSGGPWNTPEHGMQTVVTAAERVRGPAAFDGILPQPPAKLGYYRDIALVAYPTPAGAGIRMRDCPLKITTSAADTAGNERLRDGKRETSVIFPAPNREAPQFIRFEFEKPYGARRLMVTLGDRIYSCTGRLETSEDGQNFKTVRTISFPESGEQQSFSFPFVSSRFYRIVFDSVHPIMKRLAVAEAELTPEPGIDNYSGKVFINRGDIRQETLPAVSADETVSRAEVIDLSHLMQADGHLLWNVPAGDWTILRVGYTPVGQENHPAPPEGRGLECDKLSREAVDAHWAGMMEPLIRALGPLSGSTLDNVLIDSYEVGSQNWTPAFRDEFLKRRGYDLLPFLPVLAGRIVDSPETTDRFLWDFRRTIADLFAENYAGRFAELAHRHGMLFSLEPYGDCPADNLQYGSYADIPMGEFWDNNGTGGNFRIATSVAHVYGRRIAGAEAFTAAPDRAGWIQDPFSLKAEGDFAWCSGINRFVLHSCALQPWTAPERYPGMTMSRFGTPFGRTITWWKQSAPWMEYIARSQYLLQQGMFTADVCFFSGDGAPNTLRSAPLPPGYDFDGCSADALRLMSVKDGRLVLPGGMSYRLLVLPPDKTMTLPTLRKIKELADAGAVIIGPKPAKAPGLTGYPSCDGEVKSLADELWKEKIRDISPVEALAALNLPPDFEVRGDPSARIASIHRVINDMDVYFVACRDLKYTGVECVFRVSGKTPELWHPDTGRISRAPVWREENGQTVVPLQFDPAGSVFVVFRKTGSGDHIAEAEYRAEKSDEPLPRLAVCSAFYESADGSKSRDVTALLNSLIVDGTLHVTAVSRMLGGDPAPGIFKRLRVEYELDGRRAKTTVPENGVLEIGSQDSGSPPLRLEAGTDGTVELRAFSPGSVALKTVSGKTFTAELRNLPGPVGVSGPWDVSFPPGRGAPARIVLPELISWTEHADSGVRYFSGTATYTRDVKIPEEMFGKAKSIWLDLGQVKNIAELSVNGKPQGILWKPPFRADITAAARSGINRIEIKVTNLWPNRLIGDEQLPPDCEWIDHGIGVEIEKWPQWLLDGKPSPAGRFTFTTWHHWNKDDKLLPSGLLGPVSIGSEVKVQVTGTSD